MKRRIITIGAVVALLGVMIAPMTVMAANPTTGSTTVSGDIGTVYTITPSTGSLTIGPFAAAQAYTSTPDMSINVSTNDSTMTKVTITVADSKTTTKGFLTRNGTDTAGTGLTNALTVKGGAVSSYTSLATNQTLRNAVVIASANITDFSVQQTIVSGDLTKTAGTYSLIMTFTATFAP